MAIYGTVPISKTAQGHPRRSATIGMTDGLPRYSNISNDDSYFPFLFRTFAQRAWAAFRACSLRSSGLRFFAAALPPFRPSCTAAGFL
jgi:hypothetical protein